MVLKQQANYDYGSEQKIMKGVFKNRMLVDVM